MKLAIFFRSAALALIACTTFAFAQDRGTADEAKVLVEKGLAHFKAVGPATAFVEFSDTASGKWINKDIYIVVLKGDGTILAHGGNKALVGKNLWNVKDPEGRYFTRDFIAVGKKGGGWSDYHFTDPVTKKMVPKTAYIVPVPGIEGGVLSVGILKK